jgi:hypothetical protein
MYNCFISKIGKTITKASKVHLNKKTNKSNNKPKNATSKDICIGQYLRLARGKGLLIEPYRLKNIHSTFFSEVM